MQMREALLEHGPPAKTVAEPDSAKFDGPRAETAPGGKAERLRVRR
jgi:hypothetical protein